MSETGVNLFDYVNSKEVFVQDLYISKCLITQVHDEGGEVSAQENVGGLEVPVGKGGGLLVEVRHPLADAQEDP